MQTFVQSQIDQNNDGSVQCAEVCDAHHRLHAAVKQMIDLDGDRRVETHELLTAGTQLAKGAQEIGQQIRVELQQQIDTNQDGTVDPAERRAAAAKLAKQCRDRAELIASNVSTALMESLHKHLE